MYEIRSTLFWLAVVLLMLFLLMRGCESRLDRFNQWRDGMSERRQERIDDRQDRRDQGHRMWRGRRNEDPSAFPMFDLGDRPADDLSDGAGEDLLGT